jgi:hypothetical protein
MTLQTNRSALRTLLLAFFISPVALAVLAALVHADTVALWLFDEQVGLYPSCVLSDSSPGDHPLVLGRGGQIVEGMYGNALQPLDQAEIDLSPASRYTGFQRRPSIDPNRKTPPMDWSNAKFCALMTRGERHLRQEVGFSSATRTPLNLGDFDWTVEFWYQPTGKAQHDGVVLEIGTGPRGDNQQVTQLTVNGDQKGFTLWNEPSKTRLLIPSSTIALTPTDGNWHHFAFVYDASSGQIRHYVDGKLQALPPKCQLKRLPVGDEDYLSVGRDGHWQRPLLGRLDEMRISDEQVYSGDFTPPLSFSKYHRPNYSSPKLQDASPLLFAGENAGKDPVPLGSRKHLFIDDALIADRENVTFNVNPPRLAERVLDNIAGHLVVFEDDTGTIRLYYKEEGGKLAVLTSRDGVQFAKPDLSKLTGLVDNIVIDDPVGFGTIFIDPNAPVDERIKYFSGYDGRAMYVYTSPDGYRFKRNETAALPFRAASQSIAYYDDQRQKYVAFHRTDMPETVGGHTERAFVMTETTDPMLPWPFKPLSQSEQREIGKRRRIGNRLPWYLDNGPLTPPGPGIEYPTIFATDETRDPIATDIYVPKNVKYPWAPDTYLAFPLLYFHYHDDGPPTRQLLGNRDRERGSGPLETQIAVSRDGIHWKRHPRPAYIKIGRHDGLDIHKNYIAHGMVRRGEEIWQYYLGSELYHSPWTNEGREAVFRVVQRLDGFISADSHYTGGTILTRPLTFEGNRLVLNIDTGATGYAQVGLLDENGKPIAGFSIDDCVYINGDHIEIEVEWLDRGKNVSELAGRPVQLLFHMRGTKLYSMQFVNR